MAQNTSVSLGNYFEEFVRNQVSTGRYKNISEVIRAGLRLLEEEENKIIALKAEIQKGIDSPSVENFDFKENLKRFEYFGLMVPAFSVQMVPLLENTIIR